MEKPLDPEEGAAHGAAADPNAKALLDAIAACRPWRGGRSGNSPPRLTRGEAHAHRVTPDVLEALDRWKMSKSAAKAATRHAETGQNRMITRFFPRYAGTAGSFAADLDTQRPYSRDAGDHEPENDRRPEPPGARLRPSPPRPHVDLPQASRSTFWYEADGAAVDLG